MASVGLGVSTAVLWEKRNENSQELVNRANTIRDLTSTKSGLEDTVLDQNLSIETLGAQVDELEQLEDRARSLTKTVAPGSEEELDGKGGPEVPGTDALSISLSQPEGYVPQANVEEVFTAIQRTRTKLAKLIADLEKEVHRIDHTPSVWPVTDPDRSISSRYGYRKDPITGKRVFHSAIDIVAGFGSPIVAAADGKVVKAGTDGSYGLRVVLDHGYGFKTLYAHNTKILVQLGQEVEKGDEIAKLGSTGRTTGAHLHYEVHRDGKLVNPQDFQSFPKR